MMRKKLFIIMTALAVITLSSCSSGTTEEPGIPETPTQPSAPITTTDTIAINIPVKAIYSALTSCNTMATNISPMPQVFSTISIKSNLSLSKIVLTTLPLTIPPMPKALYTSIQMALMVIPSHPSMGCKTIVLIRQYTTQENHMRAAIMERYWIIYSMEATKAMNQDIL